MITKAMTASAMNGREDKQRAALDGYLEEMTTIRKRMKSTDARIRRADATIRRSLDDAWAILRHVQTSH